MSATDSRHWATIRVARAQDEILAARYAATVGDTFDALDRLAGVVADLCVEVVRLREELEG